MVPHAEAVGEVEEATVSVAEVEVISAIVVIAVEATISEAVVVLIEVEEDLGEEVVQIEADLVVLVALVIVEVEELAVAEVVQQSEEEALRALDHQNGHVSISLHNHPMDTLLNPAKEVTAVQIILMVVASSSRNHSK